MELLFQLLLAQLRNKLDVPHGFPLERQELNQASVVCQLETSHVLAFLHQAHDFVTAQRLDEGDEHSVDECAFYELTELIDLHLAL